jgi:hypothetical protein
MVSLVTKGERADVLQFALIMSADLLVGTFDLLYCLILDIKGFASELLSQGIIDPLLRYTAL